MLAEIEYRAKSAEGQAPVLQGSAGGSVMDAFDHFWQWADKPLGSYLTIRAELHRAVMRLAADDRLDREKVNAAFEASRR